MPNPTLLHYKEGYFEALPGHCYHSFKENISFVSNLQDIVEVVSKSADVNTAQLVGNLNGGVIVQVYDWAKFLGDHF